MICDGEHTAEWALANKSALEGAPSGDPLVNL